MDCNPQDHFQTPTPMIKLKSSDGEIFEVEVKVAKLSLHFKEMLGDLGVEENEVISIPQNAPRISGSILEKIIQWANHHKDDPAMDEDDDKEVKPMDDSSSWDAELLKVDQTTLFQMIRAANYLNIKGLLDVTCKTVAKMIKGMTVEMIRQRFYIPNDFSPDEEEQVRRENAWCEGHSFGLSDDTEMEKIPAHSVQHGDNEGRQVIEDCLSNSVVVRKIFQHFSDTELLKLSYINKTWNYEARSLMKKRGNLFVKVRRTHMKPCHKIFEAFLEATKQMNIVPFSGINIEPCQFLDCAHPTEVLGRFPDINLYQLKLKKVSVELFYQKDNYCPGFLLAKKLLQDFSNVLEELSFKVPTKPEGLIEKLVQECRFPRLKVLKLRKNYKYSDATYTENLRELVTRAPGLHELYTEGPINLSVDALAGTSAVLVYDQPVYAPFDEISESSISALRLENMELFYAGPEFNFDRFSRIAPALLEASCSTTLRDMHMDAVLAVPLMCYGIGLENVKFLDLRVNYKHLELFEPRILRVVKHFDFTRIFPNLKKVKICGDSSPSLSPDHMDRIIERANAVLTSPTPERAAYVKDLYLDRCNLSSDFVQFLAEMFPNVEKLEVEASTEETIPFGLIWKHWMHLAALKVDAKILPGTLNLDSVFCGIFPEEVAELSQKDEEYLISVNIVPVMPAFTCLKNLKTLELNYDGRGYMPYKDDGLVMFSKVAGLTAFARCAALAASLTTISYASFPEMDYLKPYVSVRSIVEWDDIEPLDDECEDSSDYDYSI